LKYNHTLTNLQIFGNIVTPPRANLPGFIHTKMKSVQFVSNKYKNGMDLQIEQEQ